MKTDRKNSARSFGHATCTVLAFLCAGTVGAQSPGDRTTTPETISSKESQADSWADHEGARHLSGVWRMTRTPISCQSGQEVAPSFQAVMTFNEDGTLTGFAVPPSSSPALGSPEYGLWKRERGARNYSFVDLSYSYDAGGAFSGSVELTAKVQLGASGSTLTQQTRIDFFDVNGGFLFSACGLASGTRFR
jgi:hypothetical protein